MSLVEDVVPEVDELSECEAALQYRFQDRELLQRCLTHASKATHRLNSNERLEFLGDAVLGLLVCEMLFHRFPEDPEGELTRVKSIVVSRNVCARISEAMNLPRFLRLGKGLSGSGAVPTSIAAAVFESLMAGVYLDGGLEAARELVERVVKPEVDMTVEQEHGKNYKSLLQQMAQKKLGSTPVYRLMDEKGPDHSKCFKMAAVVGVNCFPAAWGANKKDAEQRAAHNALSVLEGKEIPYESE